MLQVKSSFTPNEEQEKAIHTISDWWTKPVKDSVLLGVTGSGKTFTMAQVIEKTNLPTLIISHNKTLAGQLYQEMRDFFPDAHVSYFVSYYDYYQPEAYIPHTDKYIEKEAQINDVIDKLRLKATSNILTSSNVIVVASVSCIYNIGSPVEYQRYVLQLQIGDSFDKKELAAKLADLQYERSEFDFTRGTFRVRNNRLDVYPAYEDVGVRITADGNARVMSIEHFNTISGKKIENESKDKVLIYPAKHYVVAPETFKAASSTIREDLHREHALLKKKGKIVEAARLLQRVNYDLEMISEVGYVNGIENYSRYFDGRKPGDPPFTLLDYFNTSFGSNWGVFLDESHMTVPQIRGMYNGDVARKKTLIDYGFRLKASYDNRPLRFDEFYKSVPRICYVSATPGPYELDRSKSHVVQQLIRPTGIVDPLVDVRPASGQVSDLVQEARQVIEKGGRILVTTLTKKIAEDLTDHLKEKDMRVAYLHSDIKTLERSKILNDLRTDKIDILVGINLLREGIDLPEVTLVAILDADKEGFLRSRRSLIQTMGRAARNVEGRVILYADTVTGSLSDALSEVARRREYQLAYNKEHSITPTNIIKSIRERIVEEGEQSEATEQMRDIRQTVDYLDSLPLPSMTPMDRKALVKKLRIEMRRNAKELRFEVAIALREKIVQIETV